MLNHYVPHTGPLFTNLAQDHETQPPLNGYDLRQSDDIMYTLLRGVNDDTTHNVNETENEIVVQTQNQTNGSSNAVGFSTCQPDELLVENSESSRPTNDVGNETGTDSQLGKRKRLGRGKNKRKFAVTKLEKLVFNEHGQAVEPDDLCAKFSRFVGIIATYASYFPINVKSFRLFKKGTRVEKAWKVVKEALDWSDPDTLAKEAAIEKITKAKLNDRWKKFKHDLKVEWYYPNVGTDARWICNDNRVNINQWRLLVADWDIEKEKYSRINKRNRRQLRLHHTTGTQTFAQKRHAWKRDHPGEVLDRITFFKLIYSRKVKNQLKPVNEEVAKHFDELTALEQREQEKGREITPDVRDELYAEQFGPEKRNTVRGYGVGVEWKDVPGIVTQRRGLSRQVEVLQAQCDLQRIAAEEARKATEEARAEVERIKVDAARKEQEARERDEYFRNKMAEFEARLNNPLVAAISGAGVQALQGLDVQALVQMLSKASATKEAQATPPVGANPMLMIGSDVSDMAVDNANTANDEFRSP